MHHFLSWLSDAQNSNLVLVIATASLSVLTAAYVVLTRSMAKAIARQTTALLQPVLSLDIEYTDHRTGNVTGETNPCGNFAITNVGTQPVVLLDVRLECLSLGRTAKLEIYEGLDDFVIYPNNDRVIMSFDFKKALSETRINHGAYSYQLRAVGSDLSHQIVAEYELLPIIGMKYVRLGMPSRVRSKRIRRWFRWKYYRILDLFKRQRGKPKALSQAVQ